MTESSTGHSATADDNYEFIIREADIAPDPERGLRHRLQNVWNTAVGCGCAGILSQGLAHSFCIVFAVAAGSGATGLSRWLSTAINNGSGFIGLSTREIIQYSLPFIIAPPISYAIDKLRGGEFTSEKLMHTFAGCAVAGIMIGTVLPHQNHLDIARAWYTAQPPEMRAQIERIAQETGQSIDEAAVSVCGPAQGMKGTPVERVARYFGLNIDKSQ
jgi:hypothetical protein